jgi:hypothetical protein
VRIALLFPRNATVDNVLLKAVHVYNSYELACVAATTATAATGGGGGGGGDSVGDVSGTVSAIEGGDGSADQNQQHQRQHQQQGTDRVNAEAEATAGMDSADSTNTATTGIVQRPGAGEGLVSPAVTPVVIPPQQQQQQQQQLCKQQQSPAVRLAEPPSRLPQLLVANAVLIDVNDKAKGRFGKMLDKKYVLHSVILLC